MTQLPEIIGPPTTFASGFAGPPGPNGVLGGPIEGFVILILGVDLYPLTQPNNGSCTVTSTETRTTPNGITIFQVQQSANFPGPFHWRGMCPIYSAAAEVQLNATVGFAFTIWGVYLSDYSLD